MAFKTEDGRETWHHRITAPDWTCDCGHENSPAVHECLACGLCDSDRGDGR